MACSPNTPVTWSDFYDVGRALDVMAGETLMIPGWTNISAIEDQPWILPDKVPVSIWYTWDVFSGTPGVAPVVTNAFAATTSTGDTFDGLYTYDHGLRLYNMAPPPPTNTNNLYFIADPDVCQCKTLYQVETISAVGDWLIKEVGVGGANLPVKIECCQTLEVPQPGDSLDYTQTMVPAAYATQWAVLEGLLDVGETFWRDGKKCDDSPDDSEMSYKFEKFASPIDPEAVPLRYNYYMTRVVRKMTGYFVWGIRADYMTKLLIKITFMMENSHAAVRQVYGIGANFPAFHWEFITAGCGFTWEQACLTRLEGGEGNDQVAGNICCNARLNEPNYRNVFMGPYVWIGGAAAVTALGWDSPPPSWCGIGTCDGIPFESSSAFLDKNVKVYCETLTSLRSLIDNMTVYTNPANGLHCCCGGSGGTGCCISSNAMSGSLSLTAAEIKNKVIGVNDACPDYWEEHTECFFYIVAGYDDLIYPGCYVTGTVNGEAINEPDQGAVVWIVGDISTSASVSWDIEFYGLSSGCGPYAEVCCSLPDHALDVP